MGWKLWFKKIFASLLFKSGISVRLLKSVNLGIVLAYHRVLPANDEHAKFIERGMYVTTETFERQVRFIKEHFKVIPLSGFLAKERPKNYCAITLDDGWLDNYLYAYPILKRHEIPATIFLTTGLIGEREWLWTDKISYYLYQMTSKNSLLSDPSLLAVKELKRLLVQLNLLSFIENGEFEHVRVSLIERLKEMDHDELRKILRDIDERVRSISIGKPKGRLWLNWEEVVEMSENGISFGAHGHTHMILTKARFEIAREEIRLSKKALCENVKEKILMFSYPNGEYNNNIKKIVRDQGFEIAVTTKMGWFGSSPSMMEINRVTIHDDTSNTIPLFVYRMLQCRLPHRRNDRR